MNAIGAAIAAQLFKLLKPYIEAQLKEWAPKIIDFIQDQFKEWMPKIIEATVVSVAQSAGQLTVNTVDKVTDIIPGDVDDRLIDPIVKDVLGRLGIRL